MRLTSALTLCGLVAAGCARSAAGDLLAPDAGGPLIEGMNDATAADADSGGADEGMGSGENGGGAEPDAGGNGSLSDPDASDPLVMCPDPSTSCASPEDLGEVAGNADGAAVTRSGSGSKFFKITVSDDDSNGFGESAMGIGVKLISSVASDNYDLFLYRNGDTACADNPFRSELPGGEDSVSHIWNAAGPTQGETRVLTIEVRKVGDGCGAWNLQVTPHPCSSFTAPGADNCAEL